MNWKKTLLFISTAIGTTTLAFHVINKFIFNASDEHSEEDESNYYNWKFGNIYYKKEGTGSPVLLIHDLNHYSSSMEWDKVIGTLSKEHTVYTIDLLGCGKSDKPAITYTCYLYVQLLTDFIRDIIGEKTDIVATGASASFVTAACQNIADQIDHIILVCPESTHALAKVKIHEVLTRKNRYKRLVFILVLFSLVLLVGILGFGLTKEKEKKVQKTEQFVSSQKVVLVNGGCENMQTNPLKEETDEQMIKAVKDYYTEKKADTEFVEMYDHFKIYTKSGKYKDTYVAFVRYDMKIKDIYTEVPGLGTLYVKKDSQGNYQITQQVKKKEIREYINRIAEHEDVQALMNQTHESYQKAVGSDALLKEALDDLKDAYENSIGN